MPIVALGATLGMGFPLLAQGLALATPQGFVEQWTAARQHMDRGAWHEAERELQSLLREHAQRDYVAPYQSHLIGALQSCAFFLETTTPHPRTLVKGDLRRWNPTTGEVILRCAAPGFGDFAAPTGAARQGAALLHGMVFDDACALVVEGRSYPERGVSLIVCAGQDSSIVVQFGRAPFVQDGRQAYIPSSVSVQGRAGTVVLVDGPVATLQAGDSFRLEVEVVDGALDVRVRGRSVMGTPLAVGGGPGRALGRVGLYPEGIDAVTVSGRARPQWLTGLVDQALEARRRAFVEQGDWVRRVPAWLLKMERGVPAGPMAEVAMARQPSWRATYRHSTARYRIASDSSEALCLQVSAWLEGVARDYELILGPIPPSPIHGGGVRKPFDVYVFGGEASYTAYAGQLAGHVPLHTAGMFFPALDQLLVWDPGDPVRMAEVVRHEGLHQFLHRRLKVTPAWFNEGLASYMESADGSANERHLRTLLGGRNRLVPLKTFLFLDLKGFYTRPDVHYAQAWAVVHFLRHGPKPWRPLWGQVIHHCEQDVSEATATLRALGGQPFEDMDRALEQHLRSLMGR